MTISVKLFLQGDQCVTCQTKYTIKRQLQTKLSCFLNFKSYVREKFVTGADLKIQAHPVDTPAPTPCQGWILFFYKLDSTYSLLSKTPGEQGLVLQAHPQR